MNRLIVFLVAYWSNWCGFVPDIPSNVRYWYTPATLVTKFWGYRWSGTCQLIVENVDSKSSNWSKVNCFPAHHFQVYTPEIQHTKYTEIYTEDQHSWLQFEQGRHIPPIPITQLKHRSQLSIFLWLHYLLTYNISWNIPAQVSSIVSLSISWIAKFQVLHFNGHEHARVQRLVSLQQCVDTVRASIEGPDDIAWPW